MSDPNVEDANVSQERFTQADVQAMIDEALTKSEEKHTEELDALRQSLTNTPSSAVPDHGGGVGTKIHDTWSMFEQELARAGNHPAQQKK